MYKTRHGLKKLVMGKHSSLLYPTISDGVEKGATTLSITTFNIMTPSIVTFSIMTLSIIINKIRHSAL